MRSAGCFLKQCGRVFNTRCLDHKYCSALLVAWRLLALPMLVLVRPDHLTCGCMKQTSYDHFDMCRVLCMDGRAQVFVRDVSGFTLVGEYPEVPAYKDLEKIPMAREGSIASMSLAERIRAEMAFNADSLQQQRPPEE